MRTLLLTADDVARLLPMSDCVDAVEDAFRLLGEGKAAQPGTLSTPVAGGAFHVKAGVLPLERRYFAAKVNGNFPGNPAARGLPTIQGVVVLADADDGRILALMDSVELTARRTAAATAVAARRLARPDASVVTIYGCGVQGRAQLEALAAVVPLRLAHAVDRDPGRARRFAEDLAPRLGAEVRPAAEPVRATAASHVVVTCTTSGEFLLFPEHLSPGVFVAGVGVDAETKRELAPSVLAVARIVPDSQRQCALFGDLRHALDAGVIAEADVAAELGDIVAGRAPGRTSRDEVIVFDSTGLALQDVAAAAAVYRRATGAAAGCGPDRWVELTMG